MFGAAHRHRIETKRLVLRAPHKRDYENWAVLRQGNREHLERWEPRWSEHEFTPRSFRRRIKWYAEGAKTDTSYSFFVEKKENKALIGGVTLDAVRRGTTQRAVLGYWLARDETGNGYMTEVVEGVVDWAFKTQRLHRIEAASIPENLDSISVLQRTGFEREGYMQAYIRIDDRWQDHLLFARINPEDTKPEA